MLGYLKNKSDIYHTNNVDRLLQSAISYSGGSQQHYNIFQSLLTYPLWNDTLNLPVHDTRAAQHLLFLYPLRIQVFLSLLLYRQEIIIKNSFTSQYNIRSEILRPEEVLRINSLITRNYLSLEVIQLFDFIDEDVILTDDYLRNITAYFSINKSINSLDTDMKTAMNNLFRIFNFSSSNNETFIELALDNNRVRAADTIARYLNYKQQSRTILSQAVNQWQHQTSST